MYITCTTKNLQSTNTDIYAIKKQEVDLQPNL